MDKNREVWWIVMAQVTFESEGAPFRLEVKMPRTCTGFLPVFSEPEAAYHWAEENGGANVQTCVITRKEPSP